MHLRTSRLGTRWRQIRLLSPLLTFPPLVLDPGEQRPAPGDPPGRGQGEAEARRPQPLEDRLQPHLRHRDGRRKRR